MEDSAPEIPLDVRVELAHAAIEALATRHGVHLLHIKGPAVDRGLRTQSPGSDVDVLVRPAHITQFLRALTGAGWIVRTEFATGSPFQHAATLFHPKWGLLDVHRWFPGMDDRPRASFEHLWRHRRRRTVAHYPCHVPARSAQSLILLLHAARTPPGEAVHDDVATNWTALSDEGREEIRALARTLGAEIGLAAAIGELGRYEDDPRAALWRVFTQGGTRLDEWKARYAVASTPRAKARVVLQAGRVNRYYLSQRLGHTPSRVETATEFGRRLAQGAALGVRRALGGRRE